MKKSFKTRPGRIEGIYSIRSVNVSIDAYNLKAQKDDLHLTKAKVYFSNGESEIVDIGDIVIYNDENAYEYFDFKTSGGPSDGDSSTTLEVQEDITLLKVDNPLLTNIENLVDLQIDGIDYKDVNGAKYSKGDSLKIDLTHNIHSNPLLKYNFYKIRPIIYFEDSEGNGLV